MKLEDYKTWLLKHVRLKRNMSVRRFLREALPHDNSILIKICL